MKQKREWESFYNKQKKAEMDISRRISLITDEIVNNEAISDMSHGKCNLN